MPFEGLQFFALGVPQLHRVVITGCCNNLAIGAEGDTIDRAAMPF